MTNFYPSILISSYILFVGIASVFNPVMGGSSIADEIIILALSPFSFLGFVIFQRNSPVLSKFLSGYFIFLLLSTAVNSIVFAPISGILLSFALDAKVFIFMFSLYYMYFKLIRGVNHYYSFVSVFKGVLIVSIFFSLFMVRDLIFGGVSLVGIPLWSNGVFGFVPIGLFTHKVGAAVSMALACCCATMLYIIYRKVIFLFLLAIFSYLLIASTSAKELAVIFSCIIVILFSKNESTKVSSKYRVEFFSVSVFVLAFIFVVLMYFGDLVFGEFLSRRLSRLSETTVRGLLYSASFDISLSNFPFGSGAASFASLPSREYYYSPIYHEFGLSRFYGASPEYSHFLMDTWWPKILGESGFFGFISYFSFFFYIYTYHFYMFFYSSSVYCAFGFLVSSLVIVSSLASPVFNQDIGIVAASLMLISYSLDRQARRRGRSANKQFS